EVENHPADLSARYHLAFTLLKEQHAQEGMAMLEGLLRDNRKFTEAQYSLGQALIDSGQTAAAIEHLETAAGLAPSKAYVHYQLGRAYMKAGRAEDGRREFQLWRELKD